MKTLLIVLLLLLASPAALAQDKNLLPGIQMQTNPVELEEPHAPEPVGDEPDPRLGALEPVRCPESRLLPAQILVAKVREFWTVFLRWAFVNTER